MLATFTRHPGPDYATAEIVARRMEREELVERTAYIVEPDHQFAPCDYCEYQQDPAILCWSWDRHDATTDGSAASCSNWRCVRAVLSEAELDTEPEGIVVEHPVLATPHSDWAMAA